MRLPRALGPRGRAAVVLLVGTAAGALVAQVGLGAFGTGAAPAAPLVSSAPFRPTVSTKAVVAFDRAPNLTYECSLDDGAFRSCPSPVAFAGVARSPHTFRVRAVAPGGATSRPSAYSWRVVAPRRQLTARAPLRPVLTTGPVRPWTSRNATFAWLLPPRASAECRLDAARWRRCANPRTYLGLARGSHVFRIRAKTADGRRSSVNSFSWTIDSTVGSSDVPPPPTIASDPDTTTTSRDATFAFDVADGAAAECRLDAGSWSSCASPVVYVGLSLGTHTFCVRAVAPNGISGSETCHTWTIVAGATEEPTGAFSISGSLPAGLYPGGGGPLPLTVSNPYDFALVVSDLRVTVLAGSSQPGCDGAANLDVTQSNTAGGAVAIVVPAYGTVTLPAQGATAPVVTMLDLPTSQDACWGATFSLAYAGTGRKA